MTNKTYTLNDGTVLEVGKTVYEATPEGYLRMVTHHVEMFGGKYAEKDWLEDNSEDGWNEPPSLSGIEYAPFIIIWLPEQTDDNVIPPDEVVAYARHVQHVWFISPADNILSYIKGPINTNEMMKLEWLIAKGVTFYKAKPEGG